MRIADSWRCCSVALARPIGAGEDDDDDVEEHDEPASYVAVRRRPMGGAGVTCAPRRRSATVQVGFGAGVLADVAPADVAHDEDFVAMRSGALPAAATAGCVHGCHNVCACVSVADPDAARAEADRVARGRPVGTVDEGERDLAGEYDRCGGDAGVGVDVCECVRACGSAREATRRYLAAAEGENLSDIAAFNMIYKAGV